MGGALFEYSFVCVCGYRHKHEGTHTDSFKMFFSSVQFSSVTFATPWLQHARLLCLSPTTGACSNSCPLSWWYHPTILSSVVHFFSSLQSFPASRSFPLSLFFPSDGLELQLQHQSFQCIGASASASVLPGTIQDWFPLGLTGFISSLSKGLWGVFSNTTV